MDATTPSAKQSFAQTAKQTTFAIQLSLVVGILILIAKMYAYLITGSAAILSDAAESVVHILAVAFAAFSLRLSLKPADEDHMYGHDRISFFSAGFEGAMIVVAAIYIIFESVHKWLGGLNLEHVDTGVHYIAIATVINALLGWYLVRQGKKYHSIVLEANGKHVLTDSWTSLGVIIGLGLILMTGWLPFDPICAIFVATNILWTGGKLMRQSISGLMDESDPLIDERLNAVLQRATEKYRVEFHDLRHRNAGNKLLIEFHLLFHEDLSLSRAHELATNIEQEIHGAFPMQTEIISHLEPLEDPDGHGERSEKLP
ncbi:MAG: cation diffusion facilitator family transporter [Bacteroidota bacterium]|jgi:cation diffusion facilitator family transporter